MQAAGTLCYFGANIRVHRTAEPVLLDGYQAERHPVAASVVESNGAISNLILGSHLRTVDTSEPSGTRTLSAHQ